MYYLCEKANQQLKCLVVTTTNSEAKADMYVCEYKVPFALVHQWKIE